MRVFLQSGVRETVCLHALRDLSGNTGRNLPVVITGENFHAPSGRIRVPDRKNIWRNQEKAERVSLQSVPERNAEDAGCGMSRDAVVDQMQDYLNIFRGL